MKHSDIVNLASLVRTACVLAPLCLCLLLSAVPAKAEWFWVHGHSGRIQNRNVIVPKSAPQPIFEYGWGLDFKMEKGKSNWVHFAIPSSTEKHVRYIILHFRTNGTHAKVTEVHVWNGNKKVKTITETWHGERKPILDLGSLIKFDRGLGISVGIEGGFHPDEPNHFKFYAVGADFVEKPSPTFPDEHHP